MDEQQFNTLSKKVDTLHADHGKLDTRVALIERDLQGNGVPGMKTIVHDMDEKLDRLIKAFEAWTAGSEARADTCFYKQAVRREEDTKTKWWKVVGGIIVGATFLLLTIPSAIDAIKHLTGGH